LCAFGPNEIFIFSLGMTAIFFVGHVEDVPMKLCDCRNPMEVANPSHLQTVTSMGGNLVVLVVGTKQG
jgi:hypothetical protein